MVYLLEMPILGIKKRKKTTKKKVGGDSDDITLKEVLSLCGSFSVNCL